MDNFHEPIVDALFTPASGALGITQRQGVAVWFGTAALAVLLHAATTNIWSIPVAIAFGIVAHVVLAVTNAVAPDFLRVLWAALCAPEKLEP